MHKFSWTTAFYHMSLMLVFTLAGCGKGFKEQVQEQEEAYPGRYEARLTPINQKYGRYKGWMSITIADNQFWARVKVEGPQTKEMHAQYIHTNGRCPTMRDDLNRDGFLDFMEVYKVAGPILLPLDGNLNSQQKGLNEFPLMKKQNYYYYSEACNYQRMMDDLKAPDVITHDLMTKLKGQGLNLERRVILIYGVSESRNLPTSVRSFEGYPPNATLPIACGEIVEGSVYSSEFFPRDDFEFLDHHRDDL